VEVFKTNIAGDIFLRPPEEEDKITDIILDLASEDYRRMYKQFPVSVKQLMGKQDRVLTIDGEYLHLDSGDTQKIIKKGKTAVISIN
jgi:hypothetical protein